MALSVNSNISSLNAQRNLQKSTTALSKSMERLSSGLRINRAGDDAAGLAISTGLQAQINGMNQGIRNANDGLSLIGTAESAMSSYTDILQRLRELAVQSANDTNSSTDRQALDQEASQQLAELQRIAKTVEFNGTKLLDGSFTSKQLQVGAQANQTISISTGNLQTTQIGMVARFTGAAVPTANALSAGDLLINGVDVAPSTADGISTANASGSAIAIANAINAETANHNVTAEAQPTQFNGLNAIAGGSFNGTTEQITINGVNILSGAVVIAANDGTSVLRNAINQKTNQTGVTASVDGTGHLILAAEDGRNINVVTTGSHGDEIGLIGGDADYAGTTGGTVKITSGNDIVVTGNHPAYGGFTATTYTKDINTAINHLSLADVTGANLAIEMVDNSLKQVNSIRAGLGAITNRLELTIQNLQGISENLSASNSRIIDADFALETSNLTRNQILQQAGIAILAQANTTTQGALKLLQG